MTTHLLIFKLFLTLDGETGEGHGLESCLRHLADTVGAFVHPPQRLVDLVERVLFLRYQVQRKIPIVGITSRIRLMHSKSRRLIPLTRRTECVASDAAHLLQEHIPEIEELLALLAKEGSEAFSAVGGRNRQAFPDLGSQRRGTRNGAGGAGRSF